MVQSRNTKVDLVIEATSYSGLTDYGKIMIGNRAFEFYHARNQAKYIQIPWEEVSFVVASVMFKGKWIPRYAIETKSNGTFTFASKKPKEVLRVMQKYVPLERMAQSLSFFDVMKRGFKAMGKKKSNGFKKLKNFFTKKV